MMIPDFGSIVSSRPFVFLVGPERRAYTLHAEIVSRQSKSLAVLVNGPMAEARISCAIWEETDVPTFVRFSQYAYTGDYVVASSKMLKEDQANADDGKAPSEVGGGEAGLVEEEGLVRFMHMRTPYPAFPTPIDVSQLWAEFERRHYPQAEAFPENGPRLNLDNEDYTEVFLSHAKLIVFADYHGISPLGKLALQKLHDDLQRFELYESRIEDICQLIKYVYENTVQHPGSVCELRDLIAHYTACQFGLLWRKESFQEIQETWTDFAKDYMVYLLKRLQ